MDGPLGIIHKWCPTIFDPNSPNVRFLPSNIRFFGVIPLPLKSDIINGRSLTWSYKQFLIYSIIITDWDRFFFVKPEKAQQRRYIAFGVTEHKSPRKNTLHLESL